MQLPGNGRDAGDELAGEEGKGFQLVEDELEVVALGDFRDAFFLVETCGTGSRAMDLLAGEEMARGNGLTGSVASGGLGGKRGGACNYNGQGRRRPKGFGSCERW